MAPATGNLALGNVGRTPAYVDRATLAPTAKIAAGCAMLDFKACTATVHNFLVERLETHGADAGGLYNYYASFVRNDPNGAFTHADVGVANFLAARPHAKRYIEVGAGIGQLAALLASRGMTALAVESDPGRYKALVALIETFKRVDPDTGGRMSGASVRFPSPEIDVTDNIVIFTNIITNVSFEVEQAMIEACRGAAGIVVDLVRFTRARSHRSSWDDLSERFRTVGFDGPVEAFPWGGPDEAEPETTNAGRLVFFSAKR
jgi:hypothetical protein